MTKTNTMLPTDSNSQFAAAVARYKARREAGEVELSMAEYDRECDLRTRAHIALIRKYGAQAVNDWEQAQLRARKISSCFVPQQAYSEDMNNTVATKPLTRAALKALRLTCTHANVIELGDGAKVCTACEAVIR